MKKKLIFTTCSIVVVVSIIFLIQNASTQGENISKNEISEEIKVDVILPIKVSRPGCEESDSCYIPSNIVIPIGNSVTWLNEDVAFHSVTSGFYGKPTEIFDSGHIDPGQIYELHFEEEGVYDYFCKLHPWMKGQVIVKN